jgi:hypothetical protein
VLPGNVHGGFVRFTNPHKWLDKLSEGKNVTRLKLFNHTEIRNAEKNGVAIRVKLLQLGACRELQFVAQCRRSYMSVFIDARTPYISGLR